MEPIQGEALELCGSILFEYQSAIGAVAEAAKGADGLTALILQKHLKDLCDAHLLALKD